jgi:Uma2 family endonuclease
MSTASDLRLTNADLEAMPEDGNRYEVIDGELYVSSAPSIFHQTILTNIVGAFLDYLREHPIGRIVPGVGVIFDDYNGVIPDLVFATHERMRKAVAGGRFRAAPEIVIEILSPGASNERRDRHIKRSLYAARGAGEYWIVDPENRSVEVHRRNEAGELVFEMSLMQGDELTCGALPGFGVRVDALFV